MIMEAHIIRYKGYIACKEGIQKPANPYSNSNDKTFEAIEWEAGWNYAIEESSQVK
jgi:hypothetical protein